MPHGTLLNVTGWVVFAGSLLLSTVSSDGAVYGLGFALGLFLSGLYVTLVVDSKEF